MHASAKDLRFHIKELLETVSRGEEIIITYRGKARAKLVPIGAETPMEDELFGIWRDDDESTDVPAYLRNLRKGRFDAD